MLSDAASGYTEVRFFKKKFVNLPVTKEMCGSESCNVCDVAAKIIHYTTTVLPFSANLISPHKLLLSCCRK